MNLTSCGSRAWRQVIIAQGVLFAPGDESCQSDAKTGSRQPTL